MGAYTEMNHDEIELKGRLIRSWEQTLDKKCDELRESLPEIESLSTNDLHWLLAAIPIRMNYTCMKIWDVLSRRK